MKRLCSEPLMMLLLAGMSYAQAASPKLQAAAAATSGSHSSKTPGTNPPNILFIIMDDVGIDQMKIFGYGGATPPATPNIDAVAHAGVRF